MYPSPLLYLEGENIIVDSNGDTTDSACPPGPMDDGLGNVSIEMKIKDRKMDVGEG